MPFKPGRHFNLDDGRGLQDTLGGQLGDHSAGSSGVGKRVHERIEEWAARDDNASPGLVKDLRR